MTFIRHMWLITEVFSLIVKASTVRVVLSIAVMNRWVLKKVDVNNAFLNGVPVDVYMAQPEGFVDPYKPQHICKLKKKSIVWFKTSLKDLVLPWSLRGIFRVPSQITFFSANGRMVIYLCSSPYR